MANFEGVAGTCSITVFGVNFTHAFKLGPAMGEGFGTDVSPIWGRLVAELARGRDAAKSTRSELKEAASTPSVRGAWRPG